MAAAKSADQNESGGTCASPTANCRLPVVRTALSDVEADHSSSSRSRSSRNSAIASSSLAVLGLRGGRLASVGASEELAGRRHLGADLGSTGFGQVVVGQGDALDFRLGIAVVELHLEFFFFLRHRRRCASRTAVSPALGLEAGLGRPRRAGLAELRHPQRHRADGQLVAVLQDLLSADSLAIDERPVGAAEVTDGELVRRPRRPRNGAG